MLAARRQARVVLVLRIACRSLAAESTTIGKSPSDRLSSICVTLTGRFSRELAMAWKQRASLQ